MSTAAMFKEKAAIDALRNMHMTPRSRAAMAVQLFRAIVLDAERCSEAPNTVPESWTRVLVGDQHLAFVIVWAPVPRFDRALDMVL